MPARPTIPTDAAEAFERFLSGHGPDRLFTHPAGHPSQPTGFCPCDRGVWRQTGFYLRAAVLGLLLKLPCNRLTIAWLRHLGARIGQRVYLSPGVWIDPTFPQLLTIEDDVMIGVGARIFFHEFGRAQFQAGRVLLRRGAVIGGFALIRHGVEIGADAVVAGGAVVGRDVPAGHVALGNPARTTLPRTAPGVAR